MYHYYAKFKEIDNILIRYNTRIYFTDKAPDSEGTCLGVIIAKNPGSAKPKHLNKWCEISIGKDKMLPNVAGMFYKSLMEMEYTFKKNDYVRVLNLFKICNPNITDAMNCLKQSNMNPLEKCKIDLMTAFAIFVAWGHLEEDLNPYREMWINKLEKYRKKCFFAEHIVNREYAIKSGLPKIGESAKHPQGLEQMIVVRKLNELYLGSIL